MNASNPAGSVMNMQMAERQVGNVTILDLSGRLTIDDGVELLKDKVHSLIVEGRTRVVLNLALLSYMDSSGLGQLVSCHNSLARTTGGLTLLHVAKRNTDLLTITRLATVFQTTDSEDNALRGFQRNRDTLPPV
jgi:anti-sigma B factor antagonist